MENPRKHDKKTTTKSLPLALKMGACRFGIGGIVLFGGVMVAATIVSTLAFKRRRQRRSPAPEIEPVNGPKKLELVMKADHKDSFDESLSFDEVASLKEIQTENIQSLAPDESHNHELSGDTKDDMIVSVIGKDQENTSIHVDSAFESEEFDNSCEKIDMDSEQQVIMAAQIKDDSCLERNDGDGSEEHKHLMLIDDELNEHVDTNSLVYEEDVISIKEHEAIKVPVKDIVSEASKSEDEDHQETVFTNEAVATMEGGIVNHVEVEDNLKVQVLEEIENNGHDETGYADQIGHEVVMEEEEEATATANLLQIEVSGEEVTKLEMVDHEVEPEAQEMHQVCETFVVACVMNRLKEVVDEQTTTKEGALPKDKETAQKVKEQASVAEKFIIEEEMHNVNEMIQDEFIEATKVDDQTDNPPRHLMIAEHELVKKDEIPLVQSVKEDKNSEEDVTLKEVIKMADHEVAPEMHQVCETFVAAGVMNRLKEAVDDQTTMKEDAPSSQLMNAEEKHKEVALLAREVEEQTSIEDNLFNEDEKNNADQVIQDQMCEAMRVDYQTKHEFVKKDEIKHVNSVKENEDSEKLTPEEKISNHKTEENMEESESLRNVSEKQNASDDKEIINEDKDEKQVFVAGEAWDLKLMAWSVLISVWCICHWYSDLPFPELSLVGSLLFILVILGYRNRATYLVKYECK